MPVTLLWMGILGIYLGAAGAAGALWRRASSETTDWLPAGYASACAAGGAALILGLPNWPALARWLLAAAGGVVALGAFNRPGWLPRSLWRRAIGRGYLAGAMALAALWGLNQAMAGGSPAPLLIAVSALGAGAASSGTALRGDRSG